MKQFKAQISGHIKFVLDIYEPYRPKLSEDELKDLHVLQQVNDLLNEGNITDLSDCREKELSPVFQRPVDLRNDGNISDSTDCPKDELPIDEEQLV